MESPDGPERKWACVAVSNLIQNDPSTRRLLQGKNVVGALITRLTDSEEEVVVEAAGALRYEHLYSVFCCGWLQYLVGISASMEVMIFVQKCIINLSSHLSKRSYQRYHWLVIVVYGFSNCHHDRFQRPWPNSLNHPKHPPKMHEKLSTSSLIT